MSANVVQHPSSRRSRTPQRTEKDEILEMGFTAMHFATAYRMLALGMEVEPSILKQAETFMTYRTPVRHYRNGEPLPEEMQP